VIFIGLELNRPIALCHGGVDKTDVRSAEAGLKYSCSAARPERVHAIWNQFISAFGNDQPCCHGAKLTIGTSNRARYRIVHDSHRFRV